MDPRDAKVPEHPYRSATEVRDERTIARMRAVIRAGQITQEGFDLLGVTGRPGFMGAGTYLNGATRGAGYLRRAS